LNNLILKVWNIRNSMIYKLPAIELGNGNSVKEKDVSVLSLYSATFVRVNTLATNQIHLYSVANDQASCFLLRCYVWSEPETFTGDRCSRILTVQCRSVLMSQCDRVANCRILRTRPLY
jgi:hypothetical protein